MPTLAVHRTFGHSYKYNVSQLIAACGLGTKLSYFQNQTTGRTSCRKWPIHSLVEKIQTITNTQDVRLMSGCPHSLGEWGRQGTGSAEDVFHNHCIWVMKSLRDLVNDSEDCSGEPAKAIYNSVTELTHDKAHLLPRVQVHATKRASWLWLRVTSYTHSPPSSKEDGHVPRSRFPTLAHRESLGARLEDTQVFPTPPHAQECNL